MGIEKNLSYKDAGVDIDAADKFVQQIKTIVKPTFRHEVISDIGGFGGLFAINTQKYKEPVLVSSTDGVGTKLRIASMMGKHDTVGIDLVAMCVNDIIVMGAEPLFMLDYISIGKVDPSLLTALVSGMVKGCQEADCALIGGETAEMPSFYKPGEYDLAGFAVGVVEREKIIDGTAIKRGDRIIGIASNGIHSNGLSLARKVVFDEMGMKPDDMVEELGCTIGEELLRPTKIYVRTVMNLLRDFTINGIAHITGGGLVDNIARIIPKGLAAHICLGCWKIPPIFTFLKENGGISTSEMLRTFNNGIGMVLIVSPENEEEILLRLKALDQRAVTIGEIEKRERGKKSVVFTDPTASQ
ncbi:MAG: phosphoribosylformylglycinamidine cyclo-ligase [Desulfobacterota bacterium]|nr:phosphoribosylformylglycinamidine cyclo-ligase [Thermodesulfobacteriota bacterium]